MQKIIAANWKMHMLRSEAIGYCVEFKNKLSTKLSPDCSIIFGTPTTCLTEVAAEFQGLDNISVAAQNCHWESHGAHTGEISIEMLQDCGASSVIIGHSERRTNYGESKESAGRRASYALSKGFHVIFCVGESLEEFEANRTTEVVEAQLRVGLTGLTEESVSNLVIAYEPVWAIGTGRAATPGIAQEVHQTIRSIFSDLYPNTELPIIYGGSTNDENVASLMEQPDINGVLVGGASLNPTKFNKLIKNALA